MKKFVFINDFYSALPYFILSYYLIMKSTEVSNSQGILN
jgi:hypothetical protein